MALTNSVPYEVLAGPFRAYIGAVGATFPAVGDAEDAGSFSAWTLIGTNGELNYDRATGVVVQHRQEVVKWRSTGDGGSRKAFRTEEDLMIRLKLVDFNLEQYKHALN